MSVQILPEGQGGFASSFGNSLGQGVSQQLPEEIKRYRTKSGLEDIAKQKNLSPFDLISKLATVPGLDPGLLGVLAPALQAQLSRNEALNGGNQGFGQNQSQNSSGFLQETNQNGQPNLAPQGNQAPNPEPFDELTNNLLRYQPLNYPSRAEAQKESTRRIETLKEEFKKQTTSYLQKGKELAEGEVGGDVLSLLEQKAIQDLSSTGQSERSIVNKYARQVKEIAKEYGELRKVHSDIGLINRPTESTINSIQGINKRLTDLGVPQDQILDNTMSSLNISKGAASYILNPLRDTKAGKVMHRLKQNTGFEGIKNTFSGGAPEAKLAKEIAPLITPKDLMGSIAYIAKQKGYDANLLMGELKKIIPSDKITTDQARDLGNQGLIPKIPSLSQGWLMGWSGEGKNARNVQ
jgi:hypothetical protein